MNTPLLIASLLAIAGLAAGIQRAPAAPDTRSALAAATPAPSRDTDIDALVEDLAARSAGRITASTIGKSRENRLLHLLRIGDENKPALLIVAGLNAMHQVGIDTALGVAEKLAADHADLLDTHTVYIMPCADPDAYARVVTPGVRRDSARTIAPFDDDRDARTDEDPPTDLNNDAVISVMRVYNPPPHLGIEPTDIIDPEDPRLTRKPDRMKGETANVAILPEGTDQDADGRIAEDGPDAVDLNRNFPYKWPEFQDGAGPHPLSEPETRAIAEWLFAHDNVVALLVFGPHDNLVKIPEAGRFDATGRVPEGIENDDKPYYEEISKLFKDATKMTGAPSSDPAGSLHAWAYAHLGLYSFTTPVWVRPDLVKKDDAPKPAEPEAPPKPDDEAEAKPAGPTDAEIQAIIAEFQSATQEQRRALMQRVRAMPQEAQDRIRASFMGASQPGAARGGGGAEAPPGGGGRRARGASSTSDADDAKWLRYSDEQRNADGFIPYQPFDHPQLGPVEIGGFVPGFKLNPPQDEIPALIEQQTSFITTLLDKLPRIATDDPIVQDLGGDLWRITLRVSNTGFLPTRAAIAGKTRRLPPLRVHLDLPEDRVLAGDRLTRIPSLAGAGGSRTVQWTIRGSGGADVTAILKSPEFADTTITIPLREQTRKASPIPPPPEPPKPPEPTSTPPSPDAPTSQPEKKEPIR